MNRISHITETRLIFKRFQAAWHCAVFILIGLEAFAQSGVGGFSIPEAVTTDDPRVIKSELIYPLDQRPTPECHASTVLEIEHGIIAAWFGGTHEKHNDVGIWVSRNIDGSWSTPVEVANGIQHENLRYPCWNPVLFRNREGLLMLFYKVGPSPSEWWGMLITSRDDGQTWSQPELLGEGRHGKLLGPIKNQPVQLDNGDIISPTSMETEVANHDVWRVYFEISRDDGKTWEATDFINDGIEFDAIQPSILIHPHQQLQILCRTQQGVISQSWSKDGGRTWDKMTATDLPNPDAGTDAITLKDGRHLLVYNHTTRKGDFPKRRNMLNLALSHDGKTWKPVMTLEKQEGEYSYPTVIQASDGSIQITYTYRRQSIKYIVLDPELIKI